MAKRKPQELKQQRRRRPHGCWGHLVAAPLWVAYDANLGTLLRTCDAVGACMAVPATPHYREAMARGNTLSGRAPVCVHWVRPDQQTWVTAQQKAGFGLVAVELADSSTPLWRLEPARAPTILLLGHERQGVPDEVLTTVDRCVEIPMVGVGASLNVAVAGSLVLYRLAGLS